MYSGQRRGHEYTDSRLVERSRLILISETKACKILYSEAKFYDSSKRILKFLVQDQKFPKPLMYQVPFVIPQS